MIEPNDDKISEQKKRKTESTVNHVGTASAVRANLKKTTLIALPSVSAEKQPKKKKKTEEKNT